MTGPAPADPYLSAAPADVAAALRTVTDPHELHRLVIAICTRTDLIHHVVLDPEHGTRRRLTALVPDARRRCATPTTWRTP